LTVYDTPMQIREFKIRCVYYALLWQQRGRPLQDLGIRKGIPTPLQVLRRDYNFRGRRVEDGLSFCECLLINKTY
jgi:hypothetical protein